MPRRLAAGTELVLATHNKGKLAEIDAMLRPYALGVVSAGDLGLPEPIEDEPDFAGNARLKALAAAEASGRPALSDDSGFCVAALDGAPGVLSARWAGPGRDFAGAMARVHKEMTESRTDDPRAWFVCVLCLAWPDGHTELFEGRVDGTAVWPPRGTQGFGYDPMFVPEAATMTFGEMTPEEKHACNHRARAFALLLDACLPAATNG
jgi:XTP/dITP diphosphohydrolase